MTLVSVAFAVPWSCPAIGDANSVTNCSGKGQPVAGKMHWSLLARDSLSSFWILVEDGS